MFAKAVPLVNLTGASAAVGTGFFAWHKFRVWLLTAAHVPLCRPAPQANWSEWPEAIYAHREGRLPLPFELFRTKSDGLRRPAFAFLPHDSGIADFIALPVPTSFFGDEGHLSHVERLSLDGAVTPAVGTGVRAIGFPTGGGGWPVYPAKEQLAKVVEVSAELVKFSVASLPGLSGGPLVDEQDRLAGLVIGNNGFGRAVSPAAMRYIIECGLSEGL